jgi:nucleotide-binding universal stress UspA family protein
MSYKTILVHVDGPDRNGGVVTLAASMAARFEAHLIGTAVTGFPLERYFGDSFAANAAILNETLLILQQQARNRLAGFDLQARAAGVDSIEQSLIEDDPAMAICRRAPCSDLVVLGQSNPDRFNPFLNDDFPQQVLLHGGRPVIVVPYAGCFLQIGTRVVVGWDGSAEAARALTGALPLLKRAESVQVLSLDTARNGSADDLGAGVDIALYLARHGVVVEVMQRTVSSADQIGNALLSSAADFGADLIVMGGFAHSRIRELLWGGVTQSILAEMTVPVLLAH